jgi:hypothetical protein
VVRSLWANFTLDQIAILSSTFEIACQELEVDLEDNVSRDRIAYAILKLAKGGEFDPDKLLNYAISRFSYRN